MTDGSTLNMSKKIDLDAVSEFQKSFFEGWDNQFIAILLLSIFIEAVVVFIMARRPVDVYSEREISRIQEQYVNFVLKEDVKKEENAGKIGLVTDVGQEKVGKETGTEESADNKKGRKKEEEKKAGDNSGGNGGRKGAEGRQAARVAAAEARRISREQISQEVSNKGLLRLLTGTGSAAQGEAVSGFFTDNGGGGNVSDDLDRVLSSAGGLKTHGASGLGGGGGAGQAARGTRSDKKASIDDLVSDLGGVGSEQLSRSGELVVETPSEVGGLGRKSIYRSPDAIHEVLLSHVPAVRYCYERELKRNPELKGKIVVRITVAADGSVKEAEVVSSTLNSERVERCILARIRLWKDFQAIDPKEGDVTFRQVYTFGY